MAWPFRSFLFLQRCPSRWPSRIPKGVSLRHVRSIFSAKNKARGGSTLKLAALAGGGGQRAGWNSDSHPVPDVAGMSWANRDDAGSSPGRDVGKAHERSAAGARLRIACPRVLNITGIPEPRVLVAAGRLTGVDAPLKRPSAGNFSREDQRRSEQVVDRLATRRSCDHDEV